MAASSKLSLVGALAANVGIAVTKFVVGIATRSTVMLTEAIHSLVDTGNSGLMLLGRRRAQRHADAEHPFGYGMELYFWSFVVATIVFGGGGGVSIYQGVRALISPRPAPALLPNYVVIAIAALFEGTSLVIGFREFAKYRRDLKFGGGFFELIRVSKNPAMFLTVLEDTAALLGLALAAAGLALEHATGDPMWDALGSIAIGAVLIVEALILSIECRGLIIGEAARPPILAQVEKTIACHADLATGEARTLQLGPESILVVIQLKLSPHAPALDALVADLRRAVPQIRDVAFEITGR
jgi:cation diffusion facilitator family transporter